jgi:hypothetical protein
MGTLGGHFIQGVRSDDPVARIRLPHLARGISKRCFGSNHGSPSSTIDKTLWKDSSTFYRAAPANYYASFWHENALGSRACGFPYDDVGSYSSYVSHAIPQCLLVAIGW